MQLGSFTLSYSYLFFGRCGHTSNELIITNTSSFELTWHPTVASTEVAFTFTPSGSTLAAGESVTATVAVGDVPLGTSQQLYVSASIDADVAPSQPLGLFVDTTGRFHTPLPPDIDFGNVVIGTGSQVFIPALGSETETLSDGFSNSSFHLDNITARALVPPGGWNLTFFPSTVGPQEVILTFGTTSYGVDCPPNSIKARGVGVSP